MLNRAAMRNHTLVRVHCALSANWELLPFCAHLTIETDPLQLAGHPGHQASLRCESSIIQLPAATLAQELRGQPQQAPAKAVVRRKLPLT
jgi:hypothetical protein